MSPTQAMREVTVVTQMREQRREGRAADPSYAPGPGEAGATGPTAPDPHRPRTTSGGLSLRNLVEITALLARPRAQGRAAVALPVVAFAVTTALLLTVVGGTRMFVEDSRAAMGAEYAGSYITFSVLALLLLAVPLFSLGASAARLSARRRDDRLATLRLLGASSRQVSTISVLEATATAVVGAVAGVVLHVALLPIVGLLPFFGERIGPTAAWAGVTGVLGGVLVVTLIAALSAAFGLRRVLLTPLGVRTRQQPSAVSRARVWIGGGLVALGIVGILLVTRGAGQVLGTVAVMVVLLGVFAGGIAVLNLIGPALVAARARRKLRRADDAVALLAARGLLEDPKAAWRRVAAMSMVSFVAVVGGCGMALSAGVAQTSVDARELVFVGDVRTGVLLTLGIAFLMLACAAGVTQAAAVLDRRDLLVALDRMGMPPQTMLRVRVRTVVGPLLLAVGCGVLVASVLTFPLLGAAIFLEPLSVATVVVTFVLGFGAVVLAVRSTEPVAASVRRAPELV